MSVLQKLKLKLPKKRWKRILLYAASTFCIALAIDMSLTAYWRHIEVSKETTFITTPLLPEGTPDYITFLNDRAAQGVTPENNAAVPLVQAFGLSPTENPGFSDWEARTLQALGLPETHIPPQSLSFVQWARQHAPPGTTLSSATGPNDPLTEQWVQDETTMRAGPWNAADHPLWAQWLVDEQRTLALAHEASSRSRYFMPAFPREAPYHPGQAPGTLLPTLAPTRYTSILLLSDAMMHARDADKEVFLRDMTDALKLASLLDSQGVYILTRLVGHAMMEQAGTGIRGALASGGLKAQEARALLMAFDALPPAPPLDLTAERFSMLDLYGAAAYYGLSRAPIGGNAPKAAPLIALVVPVRYEAQMRMINEGFDRLDEAVRLPSYQNRVDETRAIQRRMVDQCNKALLFFSGYLETIDSATGGPIWIPRTCEHMQQSDTQRDLLRLALAMAAYHEEKGVYPESLDLLLGPAGILKSIPRDGFIDQPLHYRREGAGYLLYSVGPDLKDEGGDEKTDLVVRMEK